MIECIFLSISGKECEALRVAQSKGFQIDKLFSTKLMNSGHTIEDRAANYAERIEIDLLIGVDRKWRPGAQNGDPAAPCRENAPYPSS